MAKTEIEKIESALALAPTVAEAARSLGLGRTTLVEKMKKFGICNPNS